MGALPPRKVWEFEQIIMVGRTDRIDGWWRHAATAGFNAKRGSWSLRRAYVFSESEGASSIEKASMPHFALDTAVVVIDGTRGAEVQILSPRPFIFKQIQAFRILKNPRRRRK